MPRLVYALFSNGGARGGHKMAVRHVETLCALGFQATLYITNETARPTWLEHDAPVQQGGAILPDDIVVVPEDDGVSLNQLARRGQPTVVFYQGIHSAARFDRLDAFFPAPDFIAVGRLQAAELARFYPQARIVHVPCFADERRFAPTAKTPVIACTPRKRPTEVKTVHAMMGRLHPRHAGLPLLELNDASERAVAQAVASPAPHRSANRFESVGLTPLEAMASGCICAGFMGIGAREYATEQNGFWVVDDNPMAAADALAEAADVVMSGGRALSRRVEAGRATAAQWSYAVFRKALETAWMQLAPQARLRSPQSQ
jgi:hypothetical protein